MREAAAESLVLPPGVEVTPVAELPTATRRQLEHQPGDHCVTRPGTRAGSSLVDRETAALLEHFRQPTTIVDAVIAFSAAKHLDPRETLESAFDALASLVESGLLVPADSAQAEEVAASLPAGASIEGTEIVEAVHVLDDTEVYRGRREDGRAVALKIVGPAAFEAAAVALENEVAVLRRLDGVVNPELLAAGRHEGRPYAITAWRLGVELHEAAAEARALGDGRAESLRLAHLVLAAYAHLDRQGVVHADVQPRNVLVDAGGDVTLLDFGLAAIPGTDRTFMRGGVPFFQAPELASAQLVADGGLPQVSARSEQYAVAALLYLVLTGGHTHPFSLRRDEMLRQLSAEEPLPFRRHGVDDLPAVEACVRRALAREPGQRYPSFADFLDAFRTAAASDRGGRRPAADPRLDAVHDLVADVRSGLGVPGERWSAGLSPPASSIYYGGAGVAYALLRLARHLEDETLLAQADLWISRASAIAASDPRAAFWNEEEDIGPEVLGEASLFHNAAGVHCVDALIAQARGDDYAQARALERFLEATSRSRPGDLVFGRAGQLLGCATMLEALPRHLDAVALREHGDAIMDDVLGRLDAQGSIAADSGIDATGVAHGWAGFLFAPLRWCEVAGAPVPVTVGERLRELAPLAEPCGRGLRWPLRLAEPAAESVLTPSWCNGAAGLSLLWSLAEELSADSAFRELADLAAWTAYEASPEAPAGLCCGLSGRAYALLARHRASGDERWLRRARVLAARAIEKCGADEQVSLFHGDPGVAVLAVDVWEPEIAAMPLLEADPWLAV